MFASPNIRLNHLFRWIFLCAYIYVITDTTENVVAEKRSSGTNESKERKKGSGPKHGGWIQSAIWGYKSETFVIQTD